MMNDGTWKDKKLYPYRIQSGERGMNNYQVFYITGFMQCSCGRINCEHVNELREQLARDTQQLDAHHEAEQFNQRGW